MNHPSNHHPATPTRSIIKDVRTRTLAASAILAILLAGCSSSSTPAAAPASTSPADTTTSPASASPGATSAPSEAPTTTAAPTAPPTTAPAADDGDLLAAAAAKIGCTGWALSADIAPGVDEWGSCAWHATKVRLYLISSDANYKTFVAAVGAYGLTEAHLVRSGKVVAALDDQTKLSALRTAVG